MNPLILLKLSLKALQKNVYRTFLTMLGIIIGVASVITMLAIGQGSKESIESSISSLGSNLIMIFPGSFRMGGVQQGAGTSRPLEISEVEAIEKHCPSVQWVSPVVTARAQLIAGSQNWSTTVLGVYANYLHIRDISLSSGRSFTELEVRRSTKVCLLGQTVVREMFGENANPIGQSIRINKVPFKVIGILQSKGASMMGTDQDDSVIAPFFSVQRRLLGITNIHQIFASARSAETSAKAEEEIRTVLTKQLRTSSDDQGFSIRTMSEISEMLSSTSSILVILLASVAGISLIVGGIGIMNIMYVTVTERTREIGLRMAVGAKSRVILLQFLTEAVAISVTGGLIGILLGIAVSRIFGQIMEWPTTITLYSILLSFGFSTLIGIFFGWYPARKAANLIPIDALRYE
jgi:putative ABC transport system permease protein